jgi:membrane fusion protein (multidrug efflux system)
MRHEKVKLALPIAAALVFGIGCGDQAGARTMSEADSASAQDSTGVAARRVINVEVVTVEPGAFTEQVRVTGSVLANREVLVSAEEGGVVRAVYVEKGASVTTGDTLVRVDDTILRAQLAQARAQADLAADVWERRRKLYEVDKVGSELAYLEAKAAALQSKASLDVLSERVSRTVVRAPISGLLDSRDVEVGQMLAPGAPVGRIVQLDTLKVAGGVPERFAPDIRVGTSVRVSFDAVPDRILSGRVSYVGASVNPRNRTFSIELELANNGLTVKPEMVANLELVRRTIAGAISLPQEALVRVENGFSVFVVEADASGVERAVARPVSTGAAQRNRVTVTSGVRAGDRVVVVGNNQLANGDRVRIVDALQRGNADAAPGGGGR